MPPTPPRSRKIPASPRSCTPRPSPAWASTWQVPIAAEIRKVAPECIIIVDGIQHAAHGRLDIESYDVDGYVVLALQGLLAPRLRRGLGQRNRLQALKHEHLIDGARQPLGIRHPRTGGLCHLFSDVVDYFDWLGAARYRTRPTAARGSGGGGRGDPRPGGAADRRDDQGCRQPQGPGRVARRHHHRRRGQPGTRGAGVA